MDRPFISPDFALPWSAALAILPLVLVAFVLAATWSSLRRTIAVFALLAFVCGAVFVGLYLALAPISARLAGVLVVNSALLLPLAVLFALAATAGSVGWVLSLWCCTWRRQWVWFAMLLLSGMLAVIAVPLVTAPSAFFWLASFLQVGREVDLYLVLVAALALQGTALTFVYGLVGAPRQHPTVTAKVK